MDKFKEAYINYTKSHVVPLYYQPWFLDEVCSAGNWNIILAFDRENNIIGYWPLYSKKVMGQRTITVPPFTPYLGPMVITPTTLSKEHSIRSFHRNTVISLLKQLPRSPRIMVQTYPTFKNWRPLSWHGFQQTTRYTLRLNLKLSEDELWHAMKDKVRNSIRNAEQLYTVENCTDVQQLYQLATSAFTRQNINVPYKKVHFERIHSLILSKQKGFLLKAKHNGHVYACTFVAYDSDVAYLMTTGRSDQTHNGGVALLIWESLKKLKSLGISTFDFEGSMIKGIASFFDSFGGTLTPYHRLTKTPTVFHRAIFQLLGKL